MEASRRRTPRPSETMPSDEAPAEEPTTEASRRPTPRPSRAMPGDAAPGPGGDGGPSARTCSEIELVLRDSNMDVGLVPGESAVHEVLKRRDSRYSADDTEALSGAPDANEPEGLVMVPLDEVVAVASARPTLPAVPSERQASPTRSGTHSSRHSPTAEQP